MNHKSLRICQGMPVIDSLGRDLGEVGHVVTGERSGRPRFVSVHAGMFRKTDHLVPCEAVEGVDAEGRLKIGLPRDVVDMLPEYEGRPPTAEEKRSAYALLGGAKDDPGAGTDAHMVPFEDSIPRHEQGDARLEALIIIAPEELDPTRVPPEWLAGGGPGP